MTVTSFSLANSANALAAGARFRSGAVARMANLSVNTLRIWERRYQVVSPPLTDSGHRLYSPHDVARLTLLAQLTTQGHAIGTVAKRSLPDLQALADQLDDAVPASTPVPSVSPQNFDGVQRVVVGRNIARRLSSPLVMRLLAGGNSPTVYDGLSEALAATPSPATSGGAPFTATQLVVQLTTLQPEDADHIQELARRLHAGQCLVVYGFGPEHAAQSLMTRGMTVRRSPLSDRELAMLLATPAPVPVKRAPTPRRFDDATLATLAAQASTIACECQRHLAELTQQLADFEKYSASCESRTAADAQLHTYLNQMAAQARQLFEEALEKLVMENQT